MSLERQLFKPTHEMFDANNESCGLYRDCGDHWVSADVWFLGGRALQQREVEEWGWKAASLGDNFRAHYRAHHAETGSDCSCEEWTP